MLTTAEEVKRAKDLEAKKRRKAERKAKRADEAKAQGSISTQAQHQDLNTQSTVVATPVAFVFPGQGSQAVGMLQVGTTPSYSQTQSCTTLILSHMSPGQDGIVQICVVLYCP